MTDAQKIIAKQLAQYLWTCSPAIGADFRTAREYADRLWGSHIREADSILSALSEAGLMVVPVEATEEMMEAARPAFEEVNGLIALHAARMGTAGLSANPLPAAWRAMVAASQQRGPIEAEAE